MLATDNTVPAVDATAFVANGCPFCPALLEALLTLVKGGELRRLTVVNAGLDPQAAEAHGVRSVPWVRIGPFELTGPQSAARLRSLAEQAARGEGLIEHLREQLAGGRLAELEARLGREPQLAAALVALLGEAEAPMQVRLGASALLEGLAPAVLATLLPQLSTLASHADHRVRADGCHLLGLTRADAAEPVVRALLGDPSPEVREIAQEALEKVGGR